MPNLAPPLHHPTPSPTLSEPAAIAVAPTNNNDPPAASDEGRGDAAPQEKTADAAAAPRPPGCYDCLLTAARPIGDFAEMLCYSIIFGPPSSQSSPEGCEGLMDYRFEKAGHLSYFVHQLDQDTSDFGHLYSYIAIARSCLSICAHRVSPSIEYAPDTGSDGKLKKRTSLRLDQDVALASYPSREWKRVLKELIGVRALLLRADAKADVRTLPVLSNNSLDQESESTIRPFDASANQRVSLTPEIIDQVQNYHSAMLAGLKDDSIDTALEQMDIFDDDGDFGGIVEHLELQGCIASLKKILSEMIDADKTGDATKGTRNREAIAKRKKIAEEIKVFFGNVSQLTARPTTETSEGNIMATAALATAHNMTASFSECLTEGAKFISGKMAIDCLRDLEEVEAELLRRLRGGVENLLRGWCEAVLRKPTLVGSFSESLFGLSMAVPPPRTTVGKQQEDNTGMDCDDVEEADDGEGTKVPLSKAKGRTSTSRKKSKKAKTASASTAVNRQPTRRSRREKHKADPNALPSGVDELKKKPTAIPNPDLRVFKLKQLAGELPGKTPASEDGDTPLADDVSHDADDEDEGATAGKPTPRKLNYKEGRTSFSSLEFSDDDASSDQTQPLLTQPPEIVAPSFFGRRRGPKKKSKTVVRRSPPKEVQNDSDLEFQGTPARKGASSRITQDEDEGTSSEDALSPKKRKAKASASTSSSTSRRKLNKTAGSNRTPGARREGTSRSARRKSKPHTPRLTGAELGTSSSSSEYENPDESSSSSDEIPSPADRPVATTPRILPQSNRGVGVPRSSGRKARKMWTDEEVSALRAGLELYGEGKWALIKAAFSLELRDRTSVQIKDKHRTMRKNGEI